MDIAIAGGTGTLGSRVAEELRTRGHRVRVLSRRSPEYPVDLTTGEGLIDALAGCDVVVDAANGHGSPRGASRTLVDGTRRLLAAARAVGVQHHVCVSMVGCDMVPMGYLQVKAEQEWVVREGRVPWTIVRATQFHELLASALASAAKWGVVPVPRARLRTVACLEAAWVVADVAEGVPHRGRIEICGPEDTDVREMARVWRTVTGRRAVLMPVPLPGRMGQALRAGALTVERPDVRGTMSFGEWLRTEQVWASVAGTR
ncbi:NAD-dependent dehydratase [Streptomyces sp. ERV7]|uniref:SDR family oxidoreductase n=1 Tax=Streptomyces sp. ERV7 TaxID=1322334 RepID=UPI0007F52AC4|nr:NAD(P)H-binding protein [Streptomyces sp. ERV7]OAR26836.1 NAD-dependent dehydratase [Streptomyces sp. ERV7]